MKLLSKPGLALKIILLIFSAAALIFTVAFLYNYSVSKSLLEKSARENTKNLTDATVNKIENILSTVSKIADNLALQIQNSSYTQEHIRQLISRTVENNSEIYGQGIFFEPYFFGPDSLYSGSYFFNSGTGTEFVPLGSPGYHYFLMDWYQIPKELQQSEWSEPYFDEGGGNVLMTTYSVPLFGDVNGQRQFIGVLGTDISLEWLHDIIDSIKIYESGYAFIITRNGTILTHPLKDLIMNESVFSLAEENSSPILRRIGRNMIKGESSFAEIEYTNIAGGKESWISYSPIMNGWSLGLVLPVDELYADINRLSSIVLIISIAGGVLLLIIIILISRSITIPLRRLADATRNFGEGNYDIELPGIRSGDEIGRLNNALINMRDALLKTFGQLQSANRELEDYSRTLEEKVESRTLELKEKNSRLNEAIDELKSTQDQLVRSEKLASLGQLTAGIAHEIKNPLNFVNNFSLLSLGLTDELKEELDKLKDKLAPDDVDYISGIIADLELNSKKIHEHGKRADSIVKGMLLHSRGKTGEFQSINLNELIEEYVNLAYHGCRAQDSSFNVKLIKNFDASLPPINAVPQDISRVFLNIFGNAFYSVNEKSKTADAQYEPQVSVLTRRADDKAEIVIEDNGTGIPSEVLDKIFNPFFTTKPAGKGTGLGLSISYDIIVREHKGEIQAQSVPGEYTRFTITLPY